MGSDKASSARLLLALADLAGNVRELPVELLSELLPLLPPELLPRTAEAVLRIPDTLRAAPLLIGVAARASAELRRQLVVEILRRASAYRDKDRAPLLKTLAATPSVTAEFWKEIARAAEALSKARARFGVFFELSRSGPSQHRFALRSRAKDELSAFKSDTQKTDALFELVSSATPDELPWLREKAGALRNDTRRAVACEAVAKRYLTEKKWDLAVEAALAGESPKTYHRPLLRILPKLPAETRGGAIRHYLDWSAALTSPEQQLGSMLPLLKVRDLEEQFRFEAFARALIAISLLEGAAQQEEALRDLGPVLPTAIFWGAVFVADRITEPTSRARALFNLLQTHGITELSGLFLSPEEQEQLQSKPPVGPPWRIMNSLDSDASNARAGSASSSRADAMYGSFDSQDTKAGVSDAHSLSPKMYRHLLQELPEVERASLLADALGQLIPEISPSPGPIVNTGFSKDGVGDLTTMTPLRPGTNYDFWLEVGPPSATSIESQPVSLPRLPRSDKPHRLQIVLSAFHDELQFEPADGLRELHLAPSGALSSERVRFPVMTPKTEGVHRLRCSIYYEQVLLQSRLIEAFVSDKRTRVTTALKSSLDFALLGSLDHAQIAGLKPHSFSILLNATDETTHNFRFMGEENVKADADFDGNELTTQIDRARGALSLATWGSADPWDSNKHSYRYDGAADVTRLRDDLVRLAQRGYWFFDTMINRFAGGTGEAVDRLTALMRKRGRIQIASKKFSGYVLPAALIYDHLIDTALPAEKFTLCESFATALEGAESLDEHECFEGRCPNAGKKSVVCPSGFWGFRHAIGMPVANATTPPTTIEYREPPSLAAGIATDLSSCDEHIDAIKGLRENIRVREARSRDELISLLREKDHHVVYFYCHGGATDEGVPFLRVGDERSLRLTRDFIRAEKIRWEESRPLVFINGCRTAALEPRQTLDFVSAFVENAAAAGVIGTEITAFEPYATTFAERCLSKLLDGAELGDAVRSGRLAVLKQANPLGLVYVPFAVSSLRLLPVS
ncbi:MAG: hypothetical protein HY075_12505 [Deltaproteobacteria bacterium]|nr:hypothetical protein [Deltaproteobacteria bacterium]